MFVPLTVTAVPATPIVGVNPLIVGAPVSEVTVNTCALVAEPPGAVTPITPVVAPAGTAVTIWVVVDEVTLAGDYEFRAHSELRNPNGTFSECEQRGRGRARFERRDGKAFLLFEGDALAPQTCIFRVATPPKIQTRDAYRPVPPEMDLEEGKFC